MDSPHENKPDRRIMYEYCKTITQSLINKASTQIEGNCQSDKEYNSDESFSDSSVKFQNERKKVKKKAVKRQHPYKVTVSLRYGKSHQKARSKKDQHKAGGRKNYLKPAVKIQNSVEMRKEIPLKGKRGRQGGKAKGKPPQEEFNEKGDSDEESDSFYCYRVSLGYFQQFKDGSGASTSKEYEEHDWPDKGSSLITCDRVRMDSTEELELLELQRWGRTSFVSAYNLHGKMEKLDLEESKPDL